MILPDLRHLNAGLVECFDTKTGELQKREPVERKQKYNGSNPRAGTFGAASNCKVQQITQESRREAFQSLRKVRTKQSKRTKLHLGIKQKALRDAHVAWLTDKCSNWDIAVSLHFPSSTAHEGGGLLTGVIEEQMKKFFSKLEKKVINRTGRIRLKEKLSRLIVVENAASVGFHIHMAMLLPKGMHMGWFIRTLKEQWKRFWGRQPWTLSNEKAVWAEAMSGGYVKYSLKNVGTGKAEVLWCSTEL